MERKSLVKNGELRLPPGFRFHPSDEELVVQYLKRKAYSSPLPASVIPDVDVCKSDPWDLPPTTTAAVTHSKERYYFSTNAAKYPNRNRSNRATLSGYWKATGKDKPILAAAAATVVGMKKTLVFYRGRPPHASRTDWIMHEYRLVARDPQPPYNIPPMKTSEATGDWVLCRIFLKNRKNAGSKNMQAEEEQGFVSQDLDCLNVNVTHTTATEKPVFYDFLARYRDADLDLPAPCSSSSGSSDVTQLSCNNDDINNHNSYNNPDINWSSEESSSSCHSLISFKNALTPLPSM